MIWNDKKARIPFAALGILLLIGSATVSIVITGLENEHAKNVSITMESGEIDKMLSSLKNDLAICLNYAALDAMNYAGKHPVIKPNKKSSVAMDYNGGNWKNGKWTFEDMKKFNMNWIRNMTRKNMNLYIEENYIDDSFNNGRYAINVEYIKKWRDIKIKEIYMKLDSREHTKPISSVPDNIRNLFADGEEEYPVYWIFYVSLKVEIKDLKENKVVSEKVINVSSLVTSRLPILMKLTENFQKYINNTDILNNKLFLIFTLLSEAYTEGRALFQYSGQYEKVPNIVDNRWLRYLLNGAILFEEFMFFNSIDPVTAVALLLNWRDLTATGFPEEEEIEKEFNSINTNQFAKIFGKPDENLLRTISKDKNEQEIAKEKIDGAEAEINLTNIARAILYDVKYNYYYYTEDGELYKENGELPHSFKGYEIEEGSKTYVLMHPPPYHYYNKTYYEKYRKNLSEYAYHGKKWYHNGYLFNIVCDGDKLYEVKYGDLNKEVTKEIKEKTNETYHVDFFVHVSCNMEEKFKPSPPSAPCTCEEWNVEKTSISGHVEEGDVIKDFPYEEKWEVVKERQCSYKENNETIYFKQIRDYAFNFHVDASYVNDVKDPFEQTTVELSQIRHDDNLFYVSQNFVKEFVKERNNILDNLNCVSKDISFKEEHSMNWIEEEVVYALEEIMDEIKNIKATVKNIKDKSANEVIDEMVNQLIEKIEQNKSKYLDEERYMENGKYKSCGARVVAKMREWYVNEVENAVRNARDKMKNEIDKELTNKFDNNKDVEIKVNDIKAAKNKMKGINANNLPAIQFGLTMPLINYSLNWNEEIGFSINQEPDYFKPSKDTDSYKFLEKNKCLFGPTGLPILPTPVTPWVITINAWYIEIQGSFSRFEIIDTIGEMNPDMLFGESDQAYVREKSSVRDPYSFEPLGENTPISFVIDTGNI
ncbi:MAG: hypothetical protein FE044_01975, partial [Thermoplasmata archaeon]